MTGDKADTVETTPRTAARLSGKDHIELDGADGADLTFRSDRYTPNQLRVDRAQAVFTDLDGRMVRCRLVNVSSSGAAFELPVGEFLRTGQVIESFEISLEDVRLYRGRVNVINQREVDGVTVVGVALAEEYLPQDRLDSASALARSLREVDHRLDGIEAGLVTDVDDWVKVLSADFRVFLVGVKEALDAVVGLGTPGEIEDGVVRLVERRLGRRFHEFIRRMNDLPRRVAPDRSEAVRLFLHRQLRELFLPAPIYRQSLFKPLGYAGDYVVMNIAYTNHYQGETAYAKFLNRMFCELSISRAAISRLTYLQEWIERTAAERPGESLRILSLASGPAREIQDYLTQSGPEAGRVEFTLFDQDAKALAFAQSQLAGRALRFGDRVAIRYLNGAVKHLITEPERYSSLQGQDLVYSAGLFDYLRPRAAAYLLTNLFTLLNPGGRLVIGNLTPECDSQGFLENLVDWEIIYRFDEELHALAAALSPTVIRVESEATGVNKFLVLER